jgi:hypothetical protein
MLTSQNEENVYCYWCVFRFSCSCFDPRSHRFIRLTFTIFFASTYFSTAAGLEVSDALKVELTSRSQRRLLEPARVYGTLRGLQKLVPWSLHREMPTVSQRACACVVCVGGVGVCPPAFLCLCLCLWLCLRFSAGLLWCVARSHLNQRSSAGNHDLPLSVQVLRQRQRGVYPQGRG